MVEKAKRGDVRPVLQVVGFEVCKKEAANPEKEEWVQTEKQSEAEILSALYTKEKSED